MEGHHGVLKLQCRNGMNAGRWAWAASFLVCLYLQLASHNSQVVNSNDLAIEHTYYLLPSIYFIQ